MGTLPLVLWPFGCHQAAFDLNLCDLAHNLIVYAHLLKHDFIQPAIDFSLGVTLAKISVVKNVSLRSRHTLHAVTLRVQDLSIFPVILKGLGSFRACACAPLRLPVLGQQTLNVLVDVFCPR